MQERFSCVVTVCVTGCLHYLYLHFTISTMDQIKKDKDKTQFATGTWTSHCFKCTSSYTSEFSSRLLHCMSYVSFRLFWITLLPNTNKNHGKFHTQSTWLDCLQLTQVSKQTVIPYYIIPNRNSIFHKSHLKGRRTEKAFKDFYGLVLFWFLF